jgi:hypothetical protein
MIVSSASERPFQASQSPFVLRQTRLTTSLPAVIAVIGSVVVLLVYRASRATGGAAYKRRHLRRGSDEPVHVPDPFGAQAGEKLDRSGRPLPWRWERSLSRDLLGPYGLVILGVAIAVKLLSSIALVSPILRIDAPIASTPPRGSQPGAATQPQEPPKPSYPKGSLDQQK